MPQLVFEALWKDRGAQKGMRELGRQTDATHKEFQKSKASIAQFASTTAKVLGTATGAAGVWGIKIASSNEQARISFTTMLGSAQKADKLLRQLQQFAATTPFEFPEIADAGKKLLAFGFTAKEIEPNLQRLGDVASGLNIPLGELVEIYGKARVQGRLYMEDINQLTGRGIPIIQEFAKQFGVSEGQVRGLVESGKIGFPQLEKAMKSMTGEGGQFAGMMTAQSKSLAGMWSTLKDTFGQGLAKAMEPSIPVLKSLFEVLGDNARVIIPLAAGVGGLTIALWAGHKAVRAYAAIQGIMGAAAASNSRALTGLAAVVSKAGPWGLAIGTGATLLGVFAGQQAKAERETKALTDSLTFQKGALDANSRQMLIQELATTGVLDAAKRAGVAETAYVRALLQGGSARDQLLTQLDDIAVSSQEAADTGKGNTTALLDQRAAANLAADKLKMYGGSLDASKRSADLAESAFKGTSGALAGNATVADRLTTAQTKLTAAQKKLGEATRFVGRELSLLKGEALSAEEANIGWEQSIDDARRAARENGKTLDSNTEKGRSNRTSILSMVRSLNDKTVADVRNEGATKKVTARFAENRTQLIKVVTQMTGNKKAARAMIDEFLSTPKDLKTKATAETKAARKEIRELKAEIKEIKDRLAKIQYSTNAGELAKKWRVRADGSVIGAPNRAGGGPIRGFGGPRQDNVMGIDRATGRQTSWVSPGEFVVNAKAYQRNRRIVEDINADKFATGGRINNGPLNTGTRLNRGAPHDSSIGIRSHVPSAGPTYRRIGNTVGQALAEQIGERLAGGIYKQLKSASDRAAKAASDAAASSSVSSSQGRIDVGRGWGPIMRAMRRHGASNFTTYSGHHPSRARARDVTPHNWRMANAAKALSSVWYVIYRMKIASKNRGNNWRPYTPIRRTGDFRHVRHIHVARYDQGGDLPPGLTLAVNGTGRAERVTPMRRSAGSGGVTINISPVFPNYVGDRNDLKRHLVDMGRHGDLKAALQSAGVRV